METHYRLAAYDEALRVKYGPHVAGVDEVGRGSWAGPMVAGCVIFPEGVILEGLNDSKKLTHDKRESLNLLIRDQSLACGIGIASPEYIDSKGLSAANIFAMEQAALAAISALPEPYSVSVFVVDQAPCFGLHPHVMIPKGDATSQAVAAASIIAKVYRDNLMVELDAAYPGYGFREHKGYINDIHLSAVKKLGLTDIHRKSYRVKGLEALRQVTLMDML
jgi:ribonuclease HII